MSGELSGSSLVGCTIFNPTVPPGRSAVYWWDGTLEVLPNFVIVTLISDPTLVLHDIRTLTTPPSYSLLSNKKGNSHYTHITLTLHTLQ